MGSHIARNLASLPFSILRCLPKRGAKRSPKRPKRILLLMCNWLGDTFWAAQVIPTLCREYPEAEIYAGVKGFSIPLLTGLVRPENILTLRGVISDRTREKMSIKRFFADLLAVRKKKFDWVIDLTGNYFSALFTWLSGCGYSNGGNLDALAFLYSSSIPERLFAEKHLSCRPFIILSLDPPERLSPPKMALEPDEILQKLGIESRPPFAVIQRGAGWASKTIPAQLLESVARHLLERGFTVLLSGAPNEKAELERFSKAVPGVHPFSRSLAEIIALVCCADLYVGGDTGLTHIAAAGKAKVIAIYCPSNSVYSLPKGPRVRLLQSKCPVMAETRTEQCANSGLPHCPRPEWMNLDVEEIIAEIDKWE
jgi:ADP-heptose:LPS heptosyltransferase